MKKRKFLAYCLIAFAVVAVSCNKDDEPSEGDKFSEYTVEQNKSNIEDEGIKMLNEIQTFEDEPAIDASISFISFMDKNSMKNTNISSSIALSPIYSLANISQTGISGVLKSLQVSPVEEPETIQALYNELVGTYNWNSTLNRWDTVSGGTSIIFNFPSTETGTTNNASYTITYVGFTPSSNPIADYSGDLPKNVSANLKVDGNEIASLVVDINYQPNGIPTKIESTFTIQEFQWYVMAEDINNATFSSEASFKHSSNTIIKLKLDASGDWSQSNIDAHIENGEFQNVVSEGNASFQVLNLKIVGDIDIKKLGDAISAIEENNGLSNEERNSQSIAAVNEHVNLSLRYVNNNEIIALIEAYPVTRDGSYDINFRFVFADESKVDAGVYFSTGFDNLINNINNYINELNATYGN